MSEYVLILISKVSTYSVQDIELIDCDMTQILENPDVNTNSGGGLNCLTWTLFSAE